MERFYYYRAIRMHFALFVILFQETLMFNKDIIPYNFLIIKIAVRDSFKIYYIRLHFNQTAFIRPAQFRLSYCIL